MSETHEEFKLIKNTLFKPFLEKEGVFKKELPEPLDWNKKQLWSENLKPSERIFYHQTLSSARRAAKFSPKAQIPNDSLDYTLSANYDHSINCFYDKSQYVQQDQTAKESLRRLRNTADQNLPKLEKLGHPLFIAEVKEKISPHSVKLNNSGHHTQLTNPGYSRQPADGNFFNY